MVLAGLFDQLAEVGVVFCQLPLRLACTRCLGAGSAVGLAEGVQGPRLVWQEGNSVEALSRVDGIVRAVVRAEVRTVGMSSVLRPSGSACAWQVHV